jgi:hypothetical protein
MSDGRRSTASSSADRADPRLSPEGADATPATTASAVSGAGGPVGTDDRRAATPAWHLRVVAHDLVDPSDLINHPDNFRGHPVAQREALEAAIEEVGFVGEVLVSRRSGRILDGHLRVAEAIRTGQAVVPVGWIDCQSDEDEAAILATHDPIGAMATADRQKLAELAAKAQVQADPLKVMLAGLAARSKREPVDDAPEGRVVGAAFGPQGGGRGGHLGAVDDLVHPLVVECRSETEAEELLEELAEVFEDAGVRAYLLPASPSGLGG